MFRLAAFVAAIFLGAAVALPASADDCGALPYSVRVSNAGGEIQAEITADGAKGVLGKLGKGGTGTVGAEYVAGAITGAYSGAFERVIAYYRCRSLAALVAARATPLQIDAFAVRFNGLAGLYRDAQNALLLAPDDANPAKVVLDLGPAEDAKVRAAMAKPLDAQTSKTVIDAVRAVSPNDFTQLRRVEGWTKVKAKAVTVGACGGVLTNILETTHGVLQTSLSASPDLYRSFFGQSAELAAGSAASALSAYALAIHYKPAATDGFPPMTAEFQSCTSKLIGGDATSATAASGGAPGAGDGAAAPAAPSPHAS